MYVDSITATEGYRIREDTPTLKGYQIYHNYIREHEGLDGKTPAEACGITIKGKNKWKTLIQNASKNADIIRSDIPN